MNNFKQIYLTHSWDPNRYYHSKVWVDLGMIVVKNYTTLPRSPELLLRVIP